MPENDSRVAVDTGQQNIDQPVNFHKQPFESRNMKIVNSKGQSEVMTIAIQGIHGAEQQRIIEILSQGDIQGIFTSEGLFVIVPLSASISTVGKAGFAGEELVRFEIPKNPSRSIFIFAKSKEYADVVWDKLKQANCIQPDQTLKISILPNLNNFDGENVVYLGEVKNYQGDAVDFHPESLYPAKEGYRLVEQNADQELQNLHEAAMSRGNKLVARVVGVPVLPPDIAATSLYCPNVGETLFWDVLDPDVGVLIYECPNSSDAAIAAFNKDAATWVHRPGDTYHDDRLTDDDFTKKQVGDFIVSWPKDRRAMPLNDLYELVQEKGPQQEMYTEVLVDTRNPDVKLVAVCNPNDAFGWTRIAKDHGAVEFKSVPYFPEY